MLQIVIRAQERGITALLHSIATAATRIAVDVIASFHMVIAGLLLLQTVILGIEAIHNTSP